MTEILRPSVVVLHEVECGDAPRILAAADVVAPYSVHSFTDGPPDSPHLDQLRPAAKSASCLIIQDSLLGPMSPAVEEALVHAMFSNIPTIYGTFDEDYIFRAVSLRSLFEDVTSELVE